MVHIGKGIYCKRLILNDSVSIATNARQLARRMIAGVFKLETILKCTFTGKNYNPGKKFTPNAIPPIPLHNVAKSAIISKYK